MIRVDWTTFKSIVASVGVPFKYYSMNGYYYIYSTDGQVIIQCVIVQDGNSDQTDFETNYQSHAVTYNVSPLAPGSYANITGNATTNVKAGPGALMGILINDNTTGGVVTVYDSNSGSGTKIGTIQIGSPSGGLLSSSGQPGPAGWTALNMKFGTGLTVVTSGSSGNNITIIYR